MIYYCTKKMMELYDLKIPEQFETEMKLIALKVKETELGKSIFQWGCKSFYFDRRKCVLISHFASKFSIFIVDVKKDDIVNMPNTAAQYILEYYKENKKMINALNKYFAQAPIAIFDKIGDKSCIATLNKILFEWDDGLRFWDFIENNVLQTIKINHNVNFEWIRSYKINGKTEYFYPSERFEKVIMENFG